MIKTLLTLNFSQVQCYLLTNTRKWQMMPGPVFVAISDGFIAISGSCSSQGAFCNSLQDEIGAKLTRDDATDASDVFDLWSLCKYIRIGAPRVSPKGLKKAIWIFAWICLKLSTNTVQYKWFTTYFLFFRNCSLEGVKMNKNIFLVGFTLIKKLLNV